MSYVTSIRTKSLLDETSVTELMIAPDGRIYVFGLSEAVASLLVELSPEDQVLRHRLTSSNPEFEAAESSLRLPVANQISVEE